MIDMFESLRDGLGELWSELEQTEFIPRPESNDIADVREHVAQEAVAFDVAYMDAAYQLEEDTTVESEQIPASQEVQSSAASQNTPATTEVTDPNLLSEAESRARLVAQFEEQVKQSYKRN